jgi:endonuclease/exonuclease/phosphatase (EEP) superfamily protein YafD
MKSILFFLAVSVSFLSSQTFAAEPVYGPCSFACESIPDGSHVLRTFGRSISPQLNSNRIQMLVWNLYKGRKDQFRDSFATLSKGKDIIMLSEATTADPVSTSMEAVTGFGWNFATSFLMKDDVGTGTAVGSYAVAENVHYYRTTDVEPFVKSPKAITVAEYRIPGRADTLMVLSIHGINWKGDDATERQLRETVPDLKAHQGPIVFAGDFNFKNSNRLKIAQKVLAEAGLTRVTWENPNSGKQLDDAFTRGLTVRRARLINDYINTGSDHPAIELDLQQ